LEARFNPVAVRGEITGFSRAASGHCYFSLKDEQGQLRCAMFRRAAGLMGFTPRDGELVEVRGRLAVYEPRGDLQLVVESMSRAGQGALFEEFLRLKAKLEAEGLFDAARKRPLPQLPRRIGVVTSLGAAALHDVVSALQRRVPHIPVLVVPASVQGGGAPAELAQALVTLYTQAVDVILLVRGGGAIEDLWAFNDERLARTIAQSPVPVVSGVGHETDFTIADFVADMRAPTPTAAAEMVAQPREVWLGAADRLGQRLQDAAARQLDAQAQRLDLVAARLGRPSALAGRHRLRLVGMAQQLHFALKAATRLKAQQLDQVQQQLPQQLSRGLERRHERLHRAQVRLTLLDPKLVLQRGYAWLSDDAGQAITRAADTRLGQPVTATLADGTVDLVVSPPRLI
jgi:exodeoxyribonuclease VII large subunit